MAVILHLDTRTQASNKLEAYVTVFVVFQMIGFGGCTLMLGTALLSTSARRHPTWFSFIFSFVISTASYCLLLLSGHLRDPIPPYSICLVQTALIYAAPPLTAATTVALVAQIYFNISNMMTEGTQIKRQRFWTFVLLASPYVLHFSMAIGCLVVGLKNPGTVQKTEEKGYCNFGLRVPSRIASATVAFLLIPTIALEVITYLLLRKSWAVLKDRQIPIWTIVRVLVFSLLAVLWIGLGLVFAFMKNRDPDLNIILSTVPVSAVVIFGTQTDLLVPWMFWRWNWPFTLLQTTKDRGSTSSREKLMLSANVTACGSSSTPTVHRTSL